MSKKSRISFEIKILKDTVLCKGQCLFFMCKRCKNYIEYVKKVY